MCLASGMIGAERADQMSARQLSDQMAKKLETKFFSNYFATSY